MFVEHLLDINYLSEDINENEFNLNTFHYIFPETNGSRFYTLSEEVDQYKLLNHDINSQSAQSISHKNEKIRGESLNDEKKDKKTISKIDVPISKKKNFFFVFKDNIPGNPLRTEKLNIKTEVKKTDNSQKTKSSSNENEQNSPMITKFKIYQIPPPIQKRIDYAKNHFKKYFSHFLKDYGNKLILKYKLSKQMLFSPHYKSFTGNPTEKDNYMFLSFTIEQIFGYYKKGSNQIKYQEKNQILIKNILNNIELRDNREEYEEIESFFKMVLENAIKLFYKSEEFLGYQSNDKTKYLDEEILRQKGYSLIKPFGFIKMVKEFKN